MKCCEALHIDRFLPVVSERVNAMEWLGMTGQCNQPSSATCVCFHRQKEDGQSTAHTR